MFRKFLMVSALTALALAGTARAEDARAFLTTENKFPETRHLEVGYGFEQTEFDALLYRMHAAQLRYGLLENVTARLDLPYVQRDEDFGDDTSGLGDVQLGFDLLAYEDIFRYPYVIPHLDVAFATGDEEEGLGTGDAMWKLGVSIGTVVYEVLHYVLDLSYVSNYDAMASDQDDVFMGSLSIIWDVSDRFSVMGEGRFMNFQDSDDQPFLVGGGMSYDWTEKLASSVFLGSWHENDFGQDQEVLFRTSYTF